ncbi:hypothetical protein [Thermosediminibacter litoriperuensis]|uniref:Nucleic acid-binding protein n=1 Tax=Thermosediminibacter litoriperuensis TaxID=291989 RepID=A0A5S5AX85_9FIRM|nr:hypothetical protein [Thermosediminibacter litoriperuensis]TYP57440.1 hypothetical protein LZ11_00754 [Thermosediminibacter litoriperuensis]
MGSLVIDNTVLVDIEKGNLLSRLFICPYSFITTDLVYNEFKRRNNMDLVKYGLNVEGLSGSHIRQIYELRQQYPKLSIPDLSIFVLAKYKHIALLTGDKNLRILARKEGLSLHGTLWVMDEMVKNKIISPKTAIESLSLMLEQQRFLPKEECIKRIKKWSRMK